MANDHIADDRKKVRLIDANVFLKALNERPLDFLDVGGDFGYFDETIDSVVNEQPTVGGQK